jgi:hypothetical protein
MRLVGLRLGGTSGHDIFSGKSLALKGAKPTNVCSETHFLDFFFGVPIAADVTTCSSFDSKYHADLSTRLSPE